MNGEKPMYVGVSVHEPEVVSATALNSIGMTSVMLGRRSEDVFSSEVVLVIDDGELENFVADLANAIDVVRPGFWVRLTDGRASLRA